jgi:hypothetical protein
MSKTTARKRLSRLRERERARPQAAARPARGSGACSCQSWLSISTSRLNDGVDPREERQVTDPAAGPRARRRRRASEADRATGGRRRPQGACRRAPGTNDGDAPQQPPSRTARTRRSTAACRPEVIDETAVSTTSPSSGVQTRRLPRSCSTVACRWTDGPSRFPPRLERTLCSARIMLPVPPRSPLMSKER